MKRLNGTKIFSLVARAVFLACVISMFPGCRSAENFPTGQRDATAEKWSSVDLSKELFEQANRLRVSKGMAALLWSDELAEVARSHAQTMAQQRRISHAGFDGRSAQVRARGIVTRLTENVAYGMGHDAPAFTTVEGWNSSAGHRRNLLDERDSLTGVGCALTADGFFYFTQLYGR